MHGGKRSDTITDHDTDHANANAEGVMICLDQMARVIGEADALAEAAVGCGKAGHPKAAIKIAFDVEPLLFEANHILQTATNIWRRGQPTDPETDKRSGTRGDLDAREDDADD